MHLILIPSHIPFETSGVTSTSFHNPSYTPKYTKGYSDLCTLYSSNITVMHIYKHRNQMKLSCDSALFILLLFHQFDHLFICLEKEAGMRKSALVGALTSTDDVMPHNRSQWSPVSSSSSSITDELEEHIR